MMVPGPRQKPVLLMEIVAEYPRQGADKPSSLRSKDLTPRALPAAEEATDIGSVTGGFAGSWSVVILTQWPQS